MKRINLFCALLLIAGAFGQVLAYEPLVKENKKWVYYDYGTLPNDTTLRFFPVVYEFSGDTVIKNKVFLKLWEDRTSLNRQTGEVSRTETVVAYARSEVASTEHVYARRANSFRELQGVFHDEDENGCVYAIYNFSYLPILFNDTRMIKANREKYFNLTGKHYIEINGTQRICWTTDDPNRNIIEGIGYVAIDDQLFFKNFIDLEFIQPARIFGHYEEDGVIVYKNKFFDFIQDRIYVPNSDEPSGVGEVPVDDGGAVDGRTYDMQGRVVSDPSAPGIYVRDGQKVLVK